MPGLAVVCALLCFFFGTFFYFDPFISEPPPICLLLSGTLKMQSSLCLRVLFLVKCFLVNKGVDRVGLVHGGDWALSVSLTGSAACFL